ncbi:hypothetical protein TNCV_2473311 [Trichonephila clavipes]|nr:hypothetical protein TNCV_2473311 [Trichonephila clavipes]
MRRNTAFSVSQIVNCDETWYHHFELESERQSKQWKIANSLSPKKSKFVHSSSGKVLISFFTYLKGPLLAPRTGKPPPLPSVIKPLYRTLDEPSSSNA